MQPILTQLNKYSVTSSHFTFHTPVLSYRVTYNSESVEKENRQTFEEDAVV